MKIVKVTWIDACSRSGWDSLTSPDSLPPLTTVSVGFLVKQTPKYITLAQSLNKYQAGEKITIPREIIKKFEDL